MVEAETFVGEQFYYDTNSHGWKTRGIYRPATRKPAVSGGVSFLTALGVPPAIERAAPSPTYPSETFTYDAQWHRWRLATAGAIADAPSDHKLYARKDGAWIVLAEDDGPGEPTFPPAP